MQEIQETWVWSLVQEDPLEKEMATYSSIPCTEEPGRLHVVAELDTTEPRYVAYIHFGYDFVRDDVGAHRALSWLLWWS